MAAQNSVGVNTSTVPSVPTIPPPQQPDTPPLEQDQQDLQREIIIITEEEPITLATGSAVSSIEEEQGDFIFGEDEEYFEEPFTNDVIDSEPVDDIPPPSNYQEPNPGGKDLSKYISLGLYPDNNGKKVVDCILYDGYPVKKELMSDYLNMYEACLSETKQRLIIQSGYRHGFESVFYKGKQISTSQKNLRIENIISKNKYKEPWLITTTEINTGKKISGLNGGKYFKPPTAPAGFSAHGDGLALDLNTGTTVIDNNKIKSTTLNKIIYEWLINNAWKYGFIRTVPSEEWHWEYWPIQGGKYPNSPYEKVPKTNTRWYNQNAPSKELKLFTMP